MKSPSLFKYPIFRHVLPLVSGTAIAQIILILFQLILRQLNLFSPEVFGTYSVYIGLAGVVIILSTLRYEFAIVLPKEDRISNSLVAGGILISFSINLIILILICIFKDQISYLLNFPREFSYWLYLLPLTAFIYSIYQLFDYWLTRKAAFKSIAINKVTRRSAEGIIQTTFGLFASNIGLVIGDIIGNTANICSGIYQSRKHGFTLKNVSFKKIKFSLKRYDNFPKFQSLPAVLNTCSFLLPIFFINKFYSQEITGYYDLSRQVLAIPIALITASLSQVLLKNLSSKIHEKKPVTKIILQTALWLTICILPFILILILWGDYIFGFIFSDIWKESGYYSALMAPAFAIQFIVTPLAISLTALQKLKPFAIWQICYFGLILSMVFFNNLLIKDFLLLYTSFNLFTYTILFFIIMSICRKYDKTL